MLAGADLRKVRKISFFSAQVSGPLPFLERIRDEGFNQRKTVALLLEMVVGQKETPSGGVTAVPASDTAPSAPNHARQRPTVFRLLTTFSFVGPTCCLPAVRSGKA